MANPVYVIEQYYAAVPTLETAVTDMSIPFTFFDMLWILLSPVERLVFYELPISHTQFIESYIPKLKDSLSSTLKHFPPLAGNFIYPSSDLTTNPEIRYSKGDGVSIIFAESCQNNFKYLTSNFPRNVHEFHPLIPHLISSANKGSSVLALQVTLFPEVGICIGITNHHVVGDASSIFRFIKTWAVKSKHGGAEEKEDVSIFPSPPLFDRSVIKDPKGLASLFLKQMKSLNLLNGKEIYPPVDEKYKKVRQTFVLVQKDIQKLKNIVRTKRPTVKHLSTFVVTCAYVWTCLAKYCPPEDSESFVFPVDCRGRVNPPIPENYFGNCLTSCSLHAKTQELVEEDAFSKLVEKFGEILHEKLRNKDEVLADAETWVTMISKMDLKRTIGLAGSPKYNYYDLDFGWGKPIKFECTSIDRTGAISISGCREEGGNGNGNGIEIGMSFSKEKIDAFASAFNEGLAALNSVYKY